MIADNKKGFTLIEIIITIVIWSVLIIPIAFMVKEHIIGSATAADITSAYNLARLEMAKVNNLSYSDATLADGYNNTTTNYEGYKYDLNRTVNFANSPANTLKKVTVTMYESGTTRQLANLVTYVASVTVGAGSGGGASSGGGQCDYLTISAGTVSANRLHQVDMRNTSATDAITISQVTISWVDLKPDKHASLTTIEMNSVTRWSGTQSTSGSTIVLTAPFTLSANTTYTNTGIFTFSESVNTATITFIMSDGSYSSAITWYRTI